MESDFFDDDAPEAFCDYEGMYDREHAKVAALEAQLKALDWTPITAENLPKPMEDELLRPRLCSDGSAFYDVDRAGLTNLCVEAWLALGYTHRRPINPPVGGVSTGDAGTYGGKA